MADEKKKFDPPSEEFISAIRAGCGSITGTCQFCGRTYFDPEEEGGYDQRELEGLKKRAAKEPKKYIERLGGVSFLEIDGKQGIDGCECNLVRRYEEWIWNHRLKIVAYLTARANLELKRAQEEHTKISKLDAQGDRSQVK